MKIKLKKALKCEGRDLRELDIPLENLTGADLIEVEQELFRSGKVSLMPDYAKIYLIRVAARAARVPFEVMVGMDARDFTTVTNAVQSFLMVSDSEAEEEKPAAKSGSQTPSGA